jgi:preprotein translocase subunit SecA
MIDKFLTKVFGSSNQRYIKSLQPTVVRINELEAKVKSFSDDEMRRRTEELKQFVAEAVANAKNPETRSRTTSTTGSARTPTAPTSPTARTTSSASTTCATT